MSATVCPSVPPPLPSALPPSLQLASRPKSQRRWLWVFVVAVTLVTWLGVTVRNEVRRADTPQRFAELAERLFEPLATGEVVPAPTPAEMAVGLRRLRGDLHRLSRETRQLALVAEQYQATLDALTALDARKPKGSRWVFAAVELGLGVGTRNTDQISSAGKDVLRESQTIWDWVQEVRRAAQGIDTARVELLQLVPQFSGASASAPLITWRYAEKTPGLFELETSNWVSLTNVSDRDLHDCVVSIRLSNAAGESAHNIHYVAHWPRGENRLAKYVSPAAFEKTVSDVTRVDVTFWSREGSMPRVEAKRPWLGWPSANE